MEQLNKNTVTVSLVVIAVIALVIFALTYMSNGEQGAGSDLGTGFDETMQDFPETNSDNPLVTLKTNRGDITLELYMDRTPKTAGNFLTLAEKGFFDDTKFHRVINNFMIQGGDPNSKGDDLTLYGRGGPGYTIEDEFDPELSNLRGTISMANIGQPNSGGSQFFINHASNVGLDFDKQPLTSKHPVFGHVIAGMDVVDAIAQTEVQPGDIPVEPVIIESIVIAREEGDGSNVVDALSESMETTDEEVETPTEAPEDTEVN